MKTLAERLVRFHKNARSLATQAKRADLRVLASAVHGRKPEYVSVSDAVSLIESDSDIFVHGATSTPNELLNEMCAQVDAGRLSKLRLSHILLIGDVPWEQPRFHGHADYTPVFLSEIPDLFASNALPVDVALIAVTPPDENGFCSLSLNVSCGLDAMRAAKKIIALVNDTMPFTFGDSIVHYSHFDAMVRSDRPIPAHSEERLMVSEVEAKIGRTIAENLVDNGATLQLGIGAIPDSALSAMTNHKDLGVHTELLGNGVMDLIKRNVVTGAHKTLDPGKVVTSFASGSRQFYDFVHKNSIFEFRSCKYTNDVQVIRKQHKMTAINSAIEIDLTGQVASDSIGTKFYSGFGGQVDFIYGTAVAEDGEGKSIIAVPSTTPKGASKIVPLLQHGAGVVTTRGHVRYVVTEYGIAQLWGKTVRQRAYELIQIAHPDHRESLEKAAFERLKCIPAKN